MPTNTDQSVSPYFDDYNEDKNYYKVLFKPGTAVQVRELNQLQTILQAQIEKFGNNIYKRGTIIDGVNFAYHTNYSYIKINDSQLDGIPASPSAYVGNFVVDPVSNLTAYIVNSVDGFESTDPDLKTLYLRYINSGNSGVETEFTAGASLTVYDYLDSINKVTINNGSSGFANSDSVIFCSAIAVNQTSNANFSVGETITQSGNNNFAVITGIETIKGQKVLKIRPRTADLSNTAISANTWAFTPGQQIVGSVSNAVASIKDSIGTGAKATLTTTADVGKITNVTVAARGSGYTVAPYVSVKSSGVVSSIGSRNYADLDLVGRNYVAQIVVSNKAQSVGSGYAFSVTEGVIYQKGYFLRVEPQTVIVSKYSNVPDALSIGFDSVESLIDSNADSSLLDNTTGESNEFAPGADRLKVEPRLIVLSESDASANNEFLSIVDFSEGYAFRENKRTQFNSIMDEMAVRTNEQSGNFVIDKFEVTTRSTANQANDGKLFSVVTDPGKGYIDGYRVQTNSNHVRNVEKGIDFRNAVNLSSSVNYGNYILINQVVGTLNFNTGAQVQLYSAAGLGANDTSAINNGTITAPGVLLGTARIRSLVFDSGDVGTGAAVYRLYLFDIRMNNSKNFADVRSVYSGTSNKGLADIVTEVNSLTSAVEARLYDTTTGTSLVVDTGTDSTKDLTNLTYVYRSVNETSETTPGGSISTLLAAADEYFSYASTSLTDNEKKSLVLVPTGNNIVMQINASANGTASVATGSNVVTLSIATTADKYSIGDYVALYSSPSNYVIRRVTGKQAGALVVDSNAGFTGASANFSRVFPKNTAVALHDLPGATATLSGGNKTLNINLGAPIESITNVICSLSYDVKVANTTPQAKTADRNNFVRLDLSTNAGSLNGPWSLGIPDIFRLRNVYLSNSATVNTSSTDVTDQFYIDHNQTADYYGLGYLYKKSDSNINLTSSTYLLVQFDAFTSTPGVYTVNSYVSANTAQRFADDSLTLANLGTKTNSFEIPEFYSNDGKYYDLINCVDFRPKVANTATYSKTAAASTINPSETVTFDTNNKKFPLPESGVSFNRAYFLGRKDTVVINKNNVISVVRGVPSDTLPYPDAKTPKNSIVLKKLSIPSYPCVAEKFSAETYKILNRNMSNDKLLLKRIRDKTVATETTDTDIAISQPKVFTMGDINRLERRVSDLEYTVSLSLVETDLKDKVIPSALIAGTNRFKYGFFVDNYANRKNSDIDHAEYQADVIDGHLVPISESTLVTHGKGYRLADWTSEYVLVSQDQASETPVPVVTVPPEQNPPASNTAPTTPTNPTNPTSPTEPGPVVVVPEPAPVEPTPATPVQTIVAVDTSVFRSNNNSLYKRYDEYYVTMSSVPASFSINYYFYGNKDTIYVVKILLDGTEEVMYTAKLKERGTLNFAHDPSRGTLYAIRIVADSSKWQYTLTYPIDSVSYAQPTAPSTGMNTLYYTGTVSSLSPGYYSPASLSQNFGDLAYLGAGSVQTVTVVGLKPSTRHNISVSDATSSVSITPIIGGGNSDGSITTNDQGSATFQITINNNTSTAGSMASGGAAAAAGNMLVFISSADYTSIATFYATTKTGPDPVYNTNSPQATYANEVNEPESRGVNGGEMHVQ